MFDFHFFDRKQAFAVTYKNLPHWSQAGAICFITWRTADSLPVAAMDRLTGERSQVLQSFGIDPTSDWKSQAEKISHANRGRLNWELFECWDRQLEIGAGACQLKQPELSQIVADSLLHFDKERYFLTDFVVMPNHVHVLAAFAGEDALLTQCNQWKRFTARQINAILGATGPFWQFEQFDHLVRSEEQFMHYRRYIEENPRKANLAQGNYRWFSKDLNEATV